MQRRWLLQRTNPDYIAYLSDAASVSPATAQVLINRGLHTPEEVSAFMEGRGEALSDPLLIEGMEPAMRFIEEARRGSSRVLLHGDYDTDGLTGTAILTLVLRRLGLDIGYLIPNRFTDGYGFNPPAVDAAREAGAGLIITVDCGISSFEACSLAMAMGIGVVVTDHHEPVMAPSGEGPLLPEALAVINPKIANPEISTLSGAGVALKVAQALALRHPGLISHEEFMDLAALGTLADSVPLTGENRTIVKAGLPMLEEGRRAGIKALKDVARLNGRQLSSELVAFCLVPRINAPGRLSDSTEVVELLITESAERAAELAAGLDGKNTERRKIEEGVCAEAMGVIENEGFGPAIVLAREGWHEGVLGIVASRIAERFNRPAFILSIRDGVARGSARSIPQFDLLAGLDSSREALLSYGGHRQAAGLRLEVSELGSFKGLIEEAVAAEVEDFTPTLTIEAEVSLRDVSLALVRELAAFEPFGFGNPEPVLAARGLEALNLRVVGGNHLKLKLKSGPRVMDAIGFNMGGLCEVVEHASSVDAAFTATINDWAGGRTLQLNLKGLRPA